LALSSSAANYPLWWSNVVDSTATVTNDYAPANLGQLKWFATNACNELESYVPGGAGTDVWAFVTGMSLTNNNYRAVNQGQLKHVGALFYDRLIEEGYTNAYPWTAVTTDDESYAAANLGQLKYLFSFDITYDSDADSLYDWWETHHFGSVTNWTGVDDPDGDGYDNEEEYAAGATPTYSNPVPTITITYPEDGSLLP